MKTIYMVIIIWIVLTIGACTQKVDLEAEKAILRDADSKWSIAAETKDLNLLVTFYADDVLLLFPNRSIITGKEATREVFSKAFKDPNYTLSWKSSKVDVSAIADVGYTVGAYNQTYSGSYNNQIMERGKYAAFWRKDENGHWKVVVDIYNTEMRTGGASK